MGPVPTLGGTATLVRPSAIGTMMSVGGARWTPPRRCGRNATARSSRWPSTLTWAWVSWAGSGGVRILWVALPRHAHGHISTKTPAEPWVSQIW